MLDIVFPLEWTLISTGMADRRMRTDLRHEYLIASNCDTTRIGKYGAFVAIVFSLMLQACGSSETHRPQVTAPSKNYASRPPVSRSAPPATAPKRQRGAQYDIIGTASWYGGKFHGRRTANGEVYNMNQLTAAHPTLPFDTWVDITNLRNGRTVTLRINDRGPFIKGRVIDVSRRAAKKLGFINDGITRVGIRIRRPSRG